MAKKRQSQGANASVSPTRAKRLSVTRHSAAAPSHALDRGAGTQRVGLGSGKFADRHDLEHALTALG
jgi:hypothetical protein